MAKPVQSTSEQKKPKSKFLLVVGIIFVCSIISSVVSFIVGFEFRQSVGRDLCYKGAYKTYMERWDLECSHEGKEPDCELPQSLQDKVLEDRQMAEKQCDEKFPEKGK